MNSGVVRLDASMLPEALPGTRYFVRGISKTRGWRTKADILAWYDGNRGILNWTVAGNFALRGDPSTYVVTDRHDNPVRW